MTWNCEEASQINFQVTFDSSYMLICGPKYHFLFKFGPRIWKMSKKYMFQCPFRFLETTLKKLRNFLSSLAKKKTPLRGAEKKLWSFLVLTRSADCSAVSEHFGKISLPQKRANLRLSFELLRSPIGPKLWPWQSKLDSPVLGFFTSEIGLD